MSDESVQAVAVQILTLASKISALETEYALKIAALEAKIAELEAKSSKADKEHQTHESHEKRYPLPPKELPPGTIPVRDFYEQRGVPLTKLRYHRERGFNGKTLEVTSIPHKTREGISFYYLTPGQQDKAIAFWNEHGIVHSEATS